MKIKKLTAAAMTGVMVLGMGTSVCAAPATDKITEENGTATHDVQATYTTQGEAPTVHSVDITWGDLQYTYTIANEGNWNPQTHEFDGKSTSGTWSCDTGADQIKVTNHSNTAVKASFSYEKGLDYGSIAGTFDTAELSLATAEGTAVENAPTDTATLSLEGPLNKSVKTPTTIGTVTVSLGDTQ